MKLSDIGKPNPKEFEFIDPYTYEPTGIFITVHAIKSKIGHHATIEKNRKQIEIISNKDNLDEDGNIKKEVIKQIIAEYMADIVETWRGISDENGKPIKPSKQAYINAFNESEELLNAVFNFANNSGNFSSKKEPTL